MYMTADSLYRKHHAHLPKLFRAVIRLISIASSGKLKIVLLILLPCGLSRKSQEFARVINVSFYDKRTRNHY